MGSIHQFIRDITPAERAQVASRDQPTRPLFLRLFPRKLDLSLRVLEFELHFNRIVRHPYPDFREAITLYSLVVSPRVRIGFERCFMDHAVVTGTFPTDHVRVAFADRPDGNGWKAMDWPIAFEWSGKTIPVEDSTDPPYWEALHAVWMLSDMQAALSLSLDDQVPHNHAPPTLE